MKQDIIYKAKIWSNEQNYRKQRFYNLDMVSPTWNTFSGGRNQVLIVIYPSLVSLWVSTGQPHSSLIMVQKKKEYLEQYLSSQPKQCLQINWVL